MKNYKISYKELGTIRKLGLCNTDSLMAKFLATYLLCCFDYFKSLSPYVSIILTFQ